MAREDPAEVIRQSIVS